MKNEISKNFLMINKYQICRDNNNWSVCEEVKGKLDENFRTYHPTLKSALIEILERMEYNQISYHDKDIKEAIKWLEKLQNDFLTELEVQLSRQH